MVLDIAQEVILIIINEMIILFVCSFHVRIVLLELNTMEHNGNPYIVHKENV